MKRRILIFTTAAALSLGTVNLFAQQGPPANPGTCPNCPNGGTPKKDGSGPGAKRGHGNGPRDGSGPIHNPQRQGQGQGRRGGRN
ncbi:MAG: hypothetical protein JNM66_30965 [Bryobacterales bacterium]|nr:hypothetical protein [Bryobacterales bacterium]